MEYRLHGNPPYNIVAVHGGPGAPGSVFTLSKLLSNFYGTIEPFQKSCSVMGQVEELKNQILSVTKEPVFLFGHSWGAWIAYIFAYRFPESCKKIFLIGSGCFDVKYLSLLNERRLSKLSEDQKYEYITLISELNKDVPDRDIKLDRLGKLAEMSDNYCVEDGTENKEDIIQLDGNLYSAVWNEGSKLRENRYFTDIAGEIKVPIVVIHGKYDTTPIEGVVEPIKNKLDCLEWYEIDKCGHNPWKEKYGKDEFINIVRHELSIDKK